MKMLEYSKYLLDKQLMCKGETNHTNYMID